MLDTLLDELEFERRLNEFGDDQVSLLKFLARQQYQTSKLCPIHDKEIKALQNRTRKELGATGGIGAVFGAAIATAFDYFLRR